MNKKRNYGFSTIEYIALVLFILGAFLVFQNYLVRGFSGRWKSLGDTFSHGKQYDPRPYGARGSGGGTLDCFWDQETGVWVSEDCFRQNCNCRMDPGDPLYAAQCFGCKQITCGPPAYPDCQ